jgi:uncharacterized protein (DUF1015 family)
MALIRPFRALRPAPEVASHVASVPYDVVSTDEARELAARNPLSFLHVTRAEIDLPRGTDPYADEVYAQAARNLEELKRSAPLVLEDEPALYCYRLRMADHEQTGLAAAYSVDEYDHDLIKKHERTRRDKEDDRTRHIAETRAQTGVVFLTYPASAAVTAITRRVCAGAPLYDLAFDDGVRHTLWRVTGADVEAFVDAFAPMPALYIADGHHRAASAARVRQKVPGADTFLAVAFPDDQVQILSYHRVVKDLGGETPNRFLEQLRERLPVRDGAPAPARKGLVSMYLAGRWHELDVGSVRGAHVADLRDRASVLDVSLLQQHVIEPLLGIADVRTDRRIDFVGGARGTKALELLVDSGKAAVAFSMHPVEIGDLIAIADAGGIMPPKSTWFEPKLRDGLIVQLI